jgi:hypothetical protein
VRRLAAIVTSILLLACSPSAASADFGGLYVEGPAWHSSNVFRVSWTEPAFAPIGYEILNAPWAPRPDWQYGATRIEIAIPVPPGATQPPPGEYIVKLWLWSNGINNPPGPPSYLVLYYDPSAPPPPAPAVWPQWVDGHDPIPLWIEPPHTLLPPSGIRGYAVTASSNAGESPCAAVSRCTDSELDLFEGLGQRLVTVPPLPEGVSYLNVVSVSGTGIASAPASTPVYVDATPPALRFAGAPAQWVDHAVSVAAVATDPLSGSAATGPGGPLTALVLDGGPPAVAFGDSVATTVSGEGAHRLTAWARDAVGNVGAAAGAPVAVVRIDETPPRAAFAPAQRAEEPELIEVAVADVLSGPSGSRGSIEVRAAGSSQRFEALPTRATAAGLQARWSSDDYPPGSYEFRATAYDAAGNSARTDRRADGAPMVLSNPIKLPTAIDSGFGGARLVWHHCHRVDGRRRSCQREAVTDFESRPAVRTVPYGRALRFGGVLRSTTGAPLGGFSLEVVETFAPGAELAQRRTTVTSRPDGRFDAHLAPGPSRRIETFFAGTRTLTRSAGRAVTMAIRAGVRFRASTSAARIGGKPVIFSGRLLAGEASVPRTGRPIQLEFRVPGGAWSEFRTVQTDRLGRFRYAYSFTDDDSRGIRFQFRAVSPEQSDFPYRPSASAPVNVTGY